MIELRCEIMNNTGEDVWICDWVRHIPDPNSKCAANTDIFVDRDDRTLVVDGRIGTFCGRDIGCNVGGDYSRLVAGKSSPAVLRVLLSMPDYAALDAGFPRILKKGIDHLDRISFEIGYFAERDWASLQSGPDTIHQISKDESGDRINVFDSSQGEVCRAERVARVVVDGIYLPYKEWLPRENSGGRHLFSL